MKIAIFTDTFIPNVDGIVISIINSSKKFAEKGHKIYIFTVKPKEKKHRTKKLGKGIYVFYHQGIPLINYPGFRIAMPSVINVIKKFKKIRPDIVHIHTPGFLGWSALIAASLYKIPVIGTYHTLLPGFLKYVPVPIINDSKTGRNIAWAYTRWFYNRCDFVTTPSIAMKKELEKHRIKRKVVFISNGVDMKKFYPYETDKKGNKVLHVGRIGYEKNIDILIGAFKYLLKINKKAKLFIVGEGPGLEKLKDYAREQGISKNVNFLGKISHHLLPEIYSSADVFVTASTIETEGIVILEAMACGLPVVGVNKLAVPDIVRHNENGFISEAGDYKKMAEYMDRLLKDKKLNKKLSKNSLNLIKEFSLEKTTSKMLGLYRRLCDQKSRKRAAQSMLSSE